FVYLLDADARDGEQFPAAVFRLGGGGPGLVPADRLLVYAAERDLRQPQGVPRQPRRRLRLPAGGGPGPRELRDARLWRGVLARAAARGRDHRGGPRLALAAAHGDLHRPVRRGDGQVRAVSAARVVARLDGRPDADL